MTSITRLDKDEDFFEHHYIKGETIGRGHFAKVKLVQHKTTDQFAAAKILDKRLDEHSADADLLMREMELLASLQHPHIVRLYEAYDTPHSTILVCELASGGELMHRIAEADGLYTELEARRHCWSLMDAVAFMHSRGVVHRDLKPENVLLSDRTPEARLLIADFGLGRFISHEAATMETVCGTHHYLAPELVRCDRGELASYDKAVDVWGLGLIFFMMLFGYNPFLRESTLATHQAIIDCKYSFPKEDNISSAAKSLIQKMVCLDHRKRISIDAAFENKWFKQDRDGPQGLRVGKSDVRSVMKEFNARRMLLRMTNLRARGRRGSEDLAESAPRLSAILGLGGKSERRPSIDQGAPVRTKPRMRRKSSAGKETQRIVDQMRAAEIR